MERKEKTYRVTMPDGETFDTEARDAFQVRDRMTRVFFVDETAPEARAFWKDIKVELVA